MKEHYRFAVIGGGPSGSTAASLLAASGEEVCIIEKKQFPREVLCGEFLSSEVTRYLKENNLWERFLKLEPERIRSFRLINSDGKELFSELEFDAFALKRSLFDKLLLDNAVEKGAELICPAEVRSLNRVHGKIIMELKAGFEEISVSADTVIAAYGRSNPLDKKLMRSFNSKRTGLTGVKFHINKIYLNDPPESEIRIYLADGIYCGINPVNDNDYAVCFLSDAGRNPSTPGEHINYLRNRNKKFGDLFSSGFGNILPGLKFYGTSNLFLGDKEKHIAGVYFTGDASGIIAPLAGDGIGIALESAVVLNDHLRKLSSAGKPGDYSKEWGRLFRSRIRTAKFIQMVLLNSALRLTGIKAAGVFPGLLDYLITRTRSVS